MRLSFHIFHHYLEDSEPIRRILSLLANIKGNTDMIHAEVQALMDQAKKMKDIGPAIDSGFKAMALQIGSLQQQIAALEAGSVLTEEDRAAISTATSDLAATFSTLQADIPAGTGVPTGGDVPNPSDTPSE
jgi:hypothetical protein